MVSPLQAAACLLLLTASTNADLTCAFGKQSSMCYSGYLDDCDNSTMTRLDCASGCFCPSGLVQFDTDLCVEPEQCLDGFTGVTPADDKCSDYESCDECLSTNPDCYWCPYKPQAISVKGKQCRHRELNPFCPEERVDPKPTMMEEENVDFTDDVQIRPQKIKLQLRAGQPKEFTLQFKPSENFPLDVYFFLDVTGSFSRRFRDTVPQLATDLVTAFQGISTRYAVGFGTFGDKRTNPFSVPGDHLNTYRVDFSGRGDYDRCSNTVIRDVDDCNPTISFQHTTNLSTLSTEELQEVLRNISIHLNLDSLEGGMDGLVQVLTCPQIGWRDRSLRMLLYMSNAGYHLAGDGKVGAAFRPNSGECHLEYREENGQVYQEYTKDTIDDYPSVYQLRQLILGTQTNIVFAISDAPSSTSTSDFYRSLQNELKLGPQIGVTSLQANSSNIVSVIQSSFNNITQEIRLTPDEGGDFLSHLSFSYRAGENCRLSEDGLGCSGVPLNTTVSLIVTVNMTSCFPNTTTVNLRSAAFGTVELEIEPLCQCNCSNMEEMDADDCSNSGTLRCGVCECDEGRSGDSCMCIGEETGTCRVGLNDEECSGRSRGECNCGKCTCYIQEELLRTKNVTKPYFGDACQCDHLTSCGGSEDGVLCSGRGICDCTNDMCMCTEVGEVSGRLYTGDRCECNPDVCYNADYPNRTCAFTGNLAFLGDARCGCNECICDFNNNNAVPAGDGTCRQGPDLCTQREECARCAKDLESSDTDCDDLRDNGCITLLLTNNSIPDSHTEKCTFTQGRCTHTFYFSFSSSIIVVEEDEDCSGGGGELNPLVWIIPVVVVGSLLLLGIILLVIVLLIIWLLDRHEFKKFQVNLSDADWVPQENPIYVSPEQRYTNIAYKRSSQRRH